MLVLALHYIDDKNKTQERVSEFIPLQSVTAESIATALKDHLAAILPEDPKSQLICQAYVRASVMRVPLQVFRGKYKMCTQMPTTSSAMNISST